MASKRVQLTITAQRFFDDAQNKREAVRVWSLPWKLPYYIESWDSQNEQAKVWVKVPKIPAGGSVDLYIYYGSPTAESESDGESVFEFFDDFDGTELDTSKWTAYESVTVANSEIHIQGIPSTYAPIVSKTTIERPDSEAEQSYIIEARGKFDGSAQIDVIWYNGGDDLNKYGEHVYIQSDGLYWRHCTSGKSDTHAISTSLSSNTYHKFALILTPSRIGVWLEGYNQIFYDNTDNTGAGYIGLDAWSSGGAYDDWFDWVRVRKYAEQEPTVSVGSEESSDVSGWLYRRKITITNPNSYDLEHFQVAIDLDGSNFDFSKANSDGSDIRVTYGEGRYELPYYIDTWDTATPQAIIWVGIDSETKFYVELNPNNTTDESDASVMNLDEATNYSLNKFEKYT